MRQSSGMDVGLRSSTRISFLLQRIAIPSAATQFSSAPSRAALSKKMQNIDRLLQGGLIRHTIRLLSNMTFLSWNLTMRWVPTRGVNLLVWAKMSVY
jgi:hypothetical protein